MEKLERLIGTVVRGLRAPIIKEGDDLKKIVVDVVMNVVKSGEFNIRNNDILAVTESIVARAQGNYVTIDHVAQDIKAKFGGETIGVMFPILSRNRFGICLKGIAKGSKKIIMMFNYPMDEGGNRFLDSDLFEEKGIDPCNDTLTLPQFEEIFSKSRHAFVWMDCLNYYKAVIEEAGSEVEIIFANNPKEILKHTKKVLLCDIRTRPQTKVKLKEAGAEIVFGLDDILTESIDESGHNDICGMFGSNKATETRIKLFPNDCMKFVTEVQKEIKIKTGKDIEVMVYGDGAFKNQIGGMRELDDPVISPGYTKGLEAMPNEVKLKYLADNEFGELRGEELETAIKEYIANKDVNLLETMASHGTTPRSLTDLIGSLCDLTTGNGDKGTPIVYIQGYFDSYNK